VLIYRCSSARDNNNCPNDGYEWITPGEEKIEGEAARSDKNFNGYPTRGDFEGGKKRENGKKENYVRDCPIRKQEQSNFR
jgi:hypothetical protein